MIDCEQFKERVEVLSLDGPDPALDEEMLAHLRYCEECQLELREREEAWLLLPAALERSAVSEELEKSLFARIESGPVQRLENSTLAVYGRYALAVSVLFILATTSLLILFGIGRGRPSKVEIERIKQMANQVEKLEELERVFASPELYYVSMTSPDSNLKGYLVYDFFANEGHFFCYNLSPMSTGAYKLWLLGANEEVIEGSIIEQHEERLGSAIVGLPAEITQLVELRVTAETNPSASTPSRDVRLQVTIQH